jgi:thymidylate kinase
MTITAPRPLMSQVIHIEGMDLAGKSTATRGLLSQRPRAVLRRNALTVNNSIYDLADELRRKDRATSEALGHLYIAALMHDLDHLVIDGEPTVQDSTILLRSLAFNTQIGAKQVVDALLDLVAAHPRFGATVVLTASLEARYERLAKRQRELPDEVAPDDLMIHDAPEMFLAMEQSLIAYARELFDATIVDTSRLEPDAVLAAVETAVVRSEVSG